MMHPGTQVLSSSSPRRLFSPCRPSSRARGVEHIRRNLRTFGAAAKAEENQLDSKSDEYSKAMQSTMGKSLVYNHEDGMNYDLIKQNIIVGSCLQTADDVDTLKEAGITTVICLQRDTDMAYFELDIAPIQNRAKEVGLNHMRLPINDMDPLNLRLRLPDVIKEMHKGVSTAEPGLIYVHCTAGMGRAPAVALAYLWWVHGHDLAPTYEELRSKRHCSPAVHAIRAAAADILYSGDPQAITVHKPGSSNSSEVLIAGLDVGWGGRLPMEHCGGDRWRVTRELLPGRYPFKFIMDGVWSYDADLPTLVDGNAINNYVDVLPRGSSPKADAARRRIMAANGSLTEDELAKIRAGIDAVAP